MRDRKSAKDIAFDKERAKYRKTARELEHRISVLEGEAAKKDEELDALRQELEQKSDWIRRLLEYMDLPEEEMRAHIAKIKGEQEAGAITEGLMGLFGEFMGLSGIFRT